MWDFVCTHKLTTSLEQRTSKPLLEQSSNSPTKSQMCYNTLYMDACHESQLYPSQLLFTVLESGHIQRSQSKKCAEIKTRSTKSALGHNTLSTELIHEFLCDRQISSLPLGSLLHSSKCTNCKLQATLVIFWRLYTINWRIFTTAKFMNYSPNTMLKNLATILQLQSWG